MLAVFSASGASPRGISSGCAINVVVVGDTTEERLVAVVEFEGNLVISGHVDGVDVGVGVALELLEAQAGRPRVASEILQLLIPRSFMSRASAS